MHLPETAPPSEDACGLVPLEAGGGLGGAADLDWAAALVRGAPDPPPDIYSMLVRAAC